MPMVFTTPNTQATIPKAGKAPAAKAKANPPVDDETGVRGNQPPLALLEGDKVVGRVRIPEFAGNLTFGGLRRNRLFICGTTSLYAIYLKING